MVVRTLAGRRLYLHDDLDDIKLDPLLVREPPVEVWPTVICRQEVASDLLPYLINSGSILN